MFILKGNVERNQLSLNQILSLKQLKVFDWQYQNEILKRKLNFEEIF